MRFRLGLVIGFGAGYYLGARAGRERYEQLNETLQRLRRSEAVSTVADKAEAAVSTVTDKAEAAVESGVERVKTKVEEKVGKGEDKAGTKGEQQDAVLPAGNGSTLPPVTGPAVTGTSPLIDGPPLA